MQFGRSYGARSGDAFGVRQRGTKWVLVKWALPHCAETASFRVTPVPNGYQYPCCLVDGDNLVVGYSVNKEDIECGIVDATAI